MRYEVIPSESFVRLYENIGYYGTANIEIIIELEENHDIEIKEADINYWQYEDGVLVVETYRGLNSPLFFCLVTKGIFSSCYYKYSFSCG